MFVLFDMVIHRPSRPETETDLALLDTLAGYFSRFEYATGGSVPCGRFSGFAHIANQFVRDQESRSMLAEAAAEEPGNQTIAQVSQGVELANRGKSFASIFRLVMIIFPASVWSSL